MPVRPRKESKPHAEVAHGRLDEAEGTWLSSKPAYFITLGKKHP